MQNDRNLVYFEHHMMVAQYHLELMVIFLSLRCALVSAHGTSNFCISEPFNDFFSGNESRLNGGFNAVEKILFRLETIEKSCIPFSTFMDMQDIIGFSHFRVDCTLKGSYMALSVVIECDFIFSDTSSFNSGIDSRSHFCSYLLWKLSLSSRPIYHCPWFCKGPPYYGDSCIDGNSCPSFDHF